MVPFIKEAETKVKRQEKQELISSMNDIFKDAELVVVTLNKGMTVGDTESLRKLIRENKAGYRVTKNRLTRLALKDTPCEGIADLMVGPTGLAYSKDPVAAAKAVSTFAKGRENFEIVGAVMGGKKMTPAEVNALATLPSLDQLRAKILGLLNAPATKIAGVLQAPAGQVARVIGAYSNKAA